MSIFSKLSHKPKVAAATPDYESQDIMFLQDVGCVRVLRTTRAGYVMVRSPTAKKEWEVAQSKLSRPTHHTAGFSVDDEVLHHGCVDRIKALSRGGQAAVANHVMDVGGLQRPVQEYNGFKIGERVISTNPHHYFFIQDYNGAYIETIETLGDGGAVSFTSDFSVEQRCQVPEQSTERCTKIVEENAGFRADDEALAPPSTALWQASAVGANGTALWKNMSDPQSLQIFALDKVEQCVPEREGLRPGDRVRTQDGNFGEVLQLTAKGSVRVFYVDRILAKTDCKIFTRESLTRI